MVPPPPILLHQSRLSTVMMIPTYTHASIFSGICIFKIQHMEALLVDISSCPSISLHKRECACVRVCFALTVRAQLVVGNICSAHSWPPVRVFRGCFSVARSKPEVYVCASTTQLAPLAAPTTLEWGQELYHQAGGKPEPIWWA